MMAKALNPIELPLSGRVLIEASAGTGKTYTIALLYVRLVLQQSLMPSQILVVTFTEAATKELRERIRARLAEAAAVFATGDDTQHDKALIDLRNALFPNTDDWPGCQMRLRQAADSMDEAAISTIHSWCYRALSEHAFDSGSLFDLTLDNAMSAMRDEAIRDYWRVHCYPLQGIDADAVLGRWSGPDALADDLRFVLPVADQLPAVSGSISDLIRRHAESIDEELEQIRQTDWDVIDEEAVSHIEAFGFTDPLKKKIMQAWGKAFRAFCAWARGTDRFPSGIKTRSGYSALFGNFTEPTLAKHYPNGFPRPAGFGLAQRLIELHGQSDFPLGDLLGHAAVWVADRMDQVKQQQGLMGFDDLISGLKQSLDSEQGDALAVSLRRAFPVALIDEFQDTDPIQYSIFNRVFSDESTLVMIGDPKQAIYSFRGADIFTYLRARHDAGQQVWTLTKNFRSSEAMVQATNRVFEKAEQLNDGAFVLGQFRHEGLPFVSVKANGIKETFTVNGSDQPALGCFAVSTGAFDPALKIDDVRQCLANACAQQLAQWVGDDEVAHGRIIGEESIRAVLPGDCAVLVNDRNEAELMRTALQQRGLASVYLSDRESVLKSEVAGDLLLWLQAALEPRNPRRLRAAIGCQTLGLTFDELDLRLTDDSALESDAVRFQSYHVVWQRQGVFAMFQALMRDYGVAARVLAGDRGERTLTDIQHLGELLQQASEQLDGEYALVQHLGHLIASGEQASEFATTRLESDRNLVQIVTVHKSKGLEYPFVFLPFATFSRPLTNPKSPPLVVRWQGADERVHLKLSPGDSDLQTADVERLGEDIRKIYVALTRSKFATWIGVSDHKGWQDSGLGYLLGARSCSFEEALTNLPEGTPIIRITEGCAALERTQVSVYQAKSLRTLPQAARVVNAPWTVASYSRIQYGSLAGESETVDVLRDADQAAQPPIQITDPIQSFPKGAVAGTLLHDLLEFACQQGFQATLDDPDALIQETVKRCTSRNWDMHAQSAYEWLLRLIAQPWELDGATVRLCDFQQVVPEMEFLIPSQYLQTAQLDQWVRQDLLPDVVRKPALGETFNGLFKGFMDLVFEVNGRYYVMDYKSNALAADAEGYTLDAMQHEIAHHRYDLQYALYTLALHRLLKARLPNYRYEQHMGGAVYWFLRGIDGPELGLFRDRPPEALIQRMDQAFQGALA